MAILPLQLARVSNTLRMQVAGSQLSRTQNSLLQVQNELASGKKINSASDDPGAAAIVQQLHKTLETRESFLSNIQHGTTQLGAADAELANIESMLQQAKTIAQANIGADVSDSERAAAAEVIKSIYSQMLTSANKQTEGRYLFGTTNQAPFTSAHGGIAFAGSGGELKNNYDAGTLLSFTLSGTEVFGALSAAAGTNVDLDPDIAAATRLADLRGATDSGIARSSIRVGDGTTFKIIDLSNADKVGDVINAINAAGVGAVTAQLGADGKSIQLTGDLTSNITVEEAGSTTAADLGILRTVGTGAGNSLSGGNLLPKVAALTPLSLLRDGAGVNRAGGLTITNGNDSANVNLSTATKVEDVINAINATGLARAEIRADGTGIDVFNPISGTAMTIAENGGTTASDLGIRSFSPSTPLAQLNAGKGVRGTTGADFTITRQDGTTFSVDLGSATTVQDAINAINAADASGGVTATFATTGNGIVLTDTSVGAGTMSIVSTSGSSAAQDLGLTAPAVSGVITGTDANPLRTPGIFSNLARLRDALITNDTGVITEAAVGLQEDLDRTIRLRGVTGARVQELEARQDRLLDQNVSTKALLSSLEDVDYTEAIARFQTLQTSLQAALLTTSRMLNQSLLDFLS